MFATFLGVVYSNKSIQYHERLLAESREIVSGIKESPNKRGNDMNAQEVLNERQVQEVYGFSVPYLRRARRERRGPRFFKVGKLVRYRRTDIEAYLSAHAVETRDVRAPRKASSEI